MHFTDDPVGDPGPGWHQQDTEPLVTSWSPGRVVSGFQLLCGHALWWWLSLGRPWAQAVTWEDKGAFAIAAWPSAPRKQCPRAWGLPLPAGRLGLACLWRGPGLGPGSAGSPGGQLASVRRLAPRAAQDSLAPLGPLLLEASRSPAPVMLHTHTWPDSISVPSLSLNRDGSDTRCPPQLRGGPSALAPSGSPPSPAQLGPVSCQGDGDPDGKPLVPAALAAENSEQVSPSPQPRSGPARRRAGPGSPGCPGQAHTSPSTDPALVLPARRAAGRPGEGLPQGHLDGSGASPRSPADIAVFTFSKQSWEAPPFLASSGDQDRRSWSLCAPSHRGR